MEYDSKQLSIKRLIQMKEDRMLEVNPEYQRGSAWTPFQQKMFVDSILQGYPIPVIFLHQKEERAEDPFDKKELNRRTYEIIDGQQRITALYNYVKGEYKLIDPANKREAKFPNFAQEIQIAWAGKVFEDLDEQYKKKLLETKISVIIIKYSENSINEARDLFIRLQAGAALNDQEKRDAWPGNFTAFIFKIGGKYDLPGNPGHDFFSAIMKLTTASQTDRGKVRKIATQMYQLHSAFTENKRFAAIKKEDLDELYRNNRDFDKDGEKAKDFIRCLDTTINIFSDQYSPKMQNHEVFHLMLFISSLLDDSYVEKKWMSGVEKAHEEFRENTSSASAIKDDEEKSKNLYWIHYMHHTKVSADSPDTIARRHEFFSARMSEYMRKGGSLISKDPQRGFTSVEREAIYFRDDKKCLVCDSSVVWRDAEIHHVKPHSEGGETVLENGALVHKICHPRIEEDVEKYATLFQEKMNSVRESKQRKKRSKNKRIDPLPEGTEARAFYGGETYLAKIASKGQWHLVDHDGNVYAKENTPSGAAKAATGKNLNGYKFWEVKRPDDQNWMPLDSIR